MGVDEENETPMPMSQEVGLLETAIKRLTEADKLSRLAYEMDKAE